MSDGPWYGYFSHCPMYWKWNARQQENGERVVKILEISNCFECPKRGRTGETLATMHPYCTLNPKQNDVGEHVMANTLPDWCPLEDWPKQKGQHE